MTDFSVLHELYREMLGSRIDDCDEIQHMILLDKSIILSAVKWWGETGYIDFIEVSSYKTTNGNTIDGKTVYTFILTEQGKAIWTLENL